MLIYSFYLINIGSKSNDTRIIIIIVTAGLAVIAILICLYSLYKRYHKATYTKITDNKTVGKAKENTNDKLLQQNKEGFTLN